MSQTWIEPSDVRLGRTIVDHDDQNRLFPARGFLFAEGAPLRDRTWRRGQAYDQGQTSQCVAYTGKGLLNTLPLSTQTPYDRRASYDPSVFYLGAQQRDEWPGENYDGTSALGLMRYFHEVGLVQEYRWCFGLQDVLETLSHYGPVALGTWWYESMFNTDSRGGLAVSGDRAGGHETELIGIDLSDREVIGMNSWGGEWGDRGRFRLSWDDLERLLNEQGDAVTVTR